MVSKSFNVLIFLLARSPDKNAFISSIGRSWLLSRVKYPFVRSLVNSSVAVSKAPGVTLKILFKSLLFNKIDNPA